MKSGMMGALANALAKKNPDFAASLASVKNTNDSLNPPPLTKVLTAVPNGGKTSTGDLNWDGL
jgi:hypothetical protein